MNTTEPISNLKHNSKPLSIDTHLPKLLLRHKEGDGLTKKKKKKTPNEPPPWNNMELFLVKKPSSIIPINCYGNSK
jgi:hypothetical protein